MLELLAWLILQDGGAHVLRLSQLKATINPTKLQEIVVVRHNSQVKICGNVK
jgi:hypothetical protein